MSQDAENRPWMAAGSHEDRQAGGSRSAHSLPQGSERPQPPHGVQATPGWPAVAIPGRPGWWRHFINGQQVDLPTRQPPAAEGG
jgi:hypothetical protein